MLNRKNITPLCYLIVLIIYGFTSDLDAESLSLHGHLIMLGVISFLFIFLAAPTVESATSQFFILTLAITCLFLGSIILVNYWVNPFGLYSPDLYEPIVVNSRNQKVELYEEQPQTPEILVLGSSRSFTVAPAYIEALTGKPVFNASVTGGVPRDFVAFFNYLLDHNKLPDLFLVGLSIDQIVLDYVPLEPDRLAQYVETSNPFNVAYQFKNLLTFQQLEASITVLLRKPDHQNAIYYYFDFDGLGHYIDPRSLEQAVEGNLGAWRDYFVDASLNAVALDYMHEFLTLADENGVDVILYNAAYHPRLQAIYDEADDYDRILTEFYDVLEMWQQDLDFEMYDFTTLASYGGTGQLFHDAAHPSEEGHRLMLDVIFES